MALRPMNLRVSFSNTRSPIPQGRELGKDSWAHASKVLKAGRPRKWGNLLILLGKKQYFGELSISFTRNVVLRLEEVFSV